jgi:hypothetical protein
METIAEALKRAAQSTRSVAAQGNVGPLDIEVLVRSPAATLAIRPDSREEAAMLLDGWAENVKCANCEIPVALLFEENYFESATGRGALCAKCLEDELDGDSV